MQTLGPFGGAGQRRQPFALREPPVLRFLGVADPLDPIGIHRIAQPAAQDPIVPLAEAGEELLVGQLDCLRRPSCRARRASDNPRSRPACRRDPRAPPRSSLRPSSGRSTPSDRACAGSVSRSGRTPGGARRARARGRATRRARDTRGLRACSIASKGSDPQVNGPWLATSTAGTPRTRGRRCGTSRRSPGRCSSRTRSRLPRSSSAA